MRSKNKNKNRLREDDLTTDELAEKELSGMAKSVIGEEKAEMASNKPEFDLKVDENTLSSVPA